MNTDLIKTAYENGLKAGDHDTRAGSIFRTAFPAAADYGYSKDGDPVLFGAFVGGYLSGINEGENGGVTIDEFGIVQ